MQTKRKFLKRALVATILISLFACLWVAYKHRSASSTKPLFQIGVYDSYAWISDHELLLVRDDGGSTPVGHWCVSRMDVNTRRETPLSALSDCFNQLMYSDKSCQVSPDGKRLLWLDYHTVKSNFMGGPHSYKVIGATLDAKQVSSCPLNSTMGRDAVMPNSFCWEPDSLHWLDIRSDLDSGDNVGQIRVHLFGSPSYKRMSGLTELASFSAQNEFILRQGDLFYQELDFRHSQTILHEIGLKTTGKLLHSYSISEPSSGFPETMAFSPTGDLIAYVFECDQTDAWWSKVQHYLRLLPAPPEYVLKLKVCNIDGSNRREVAMTDPGMESKDFDPARDLQWKPDGKSLSFVYKGAFYVVSNH